MIIVGLGNPGKEYEGTRHNVGFMVLDMLADKLGANSWKEEFGVRWTKVGAHWLVKPQEYMNVSGSTMRNFQKKKNIGFDQETDIIAVQDDLDFPLGEIHEQFNRSAAGHNGISSMIEEYGQEFHRMRIGIGNNREHNIPAEDYVLQHFSKEEQPVIEQAVQQAVELLAKKV